MSKLKFKKPTKRKRTRKFGHVRMNGYDCFFLFLPLIPFVLLLDWLNSQYYKSLKWSNRRADKILNHYVPKMAEYDEERNAFYLDTSWHSYNCIPFGHRKWSGKFGIALDKYLLNDYYPEGYIKEVYKEDYYSPVIYFKKIEK